MFRIAKAKPTEFLVVGRKGKLTNAGIGASATLPLRASYVTVPCVKQEAQFSMTQESKDGIPLRFKGIVVFRVTDPVAAASSFDFTSQAGLEQVRELIAHICLGELRALVSLLSMQECIEQRKSTLSETLEAALRRVSSASGNDEREGPSWGMEMEIVQVAQVFIVDDELRAKLESELRDEIDSRSERSHIEMQERIALARTESDSRIAQARLESAKQENEIAQEELSLAKELETRKIESTAPNRKLELTLKREEVALQIDLQEQVNRLRGLEAEADLDRDRARQSLEMEMLPLRQVPAIAEALGGMFQGADLALYGTDNQLISTLTPLVDVLADRLKRAMGSPEPRG